MKSGPARNEYLSTKPGYFVPQDGVKHLAPIMMMSIEAEDSPEVLIPGSFLPNDVENYHLGH